MLNPEPLTHLGDGELATFPFLTPGETIANA